MTDSLLDFWVIWLLVFDGSFFGVVGGFLGGDFGLFLGCVPRVMDPLSSRYPPVGVGVRGTIGYGGVPKEPNLG